MNKNVNPKISVLMPVYNCMRFIEESINSILNQTFRDYEFIIIDDCSSDGTFEYIQSLYDPRIRIIRKTQRTGITVSLNMGLDVAKGEYIARMDGDDISVPNRFERQVAFMDENPEVVACGGGYEAIGIPDIKYVPNSSNDDIILDLFSFSCIAHPTVFLRSIILKNNNIRYDLNYEPAEDYKMWTILSEYGKLANIKDVLLYYRLHPNQISNQRAASQKELKKLISFEYIKCLSNNNENIDLFCNSKLQTIKDFRKYESVENDIRYTLKARGINTNEKFFFERKRHHIEWSLNRIEYSLPQAIEDFKLLFRSRSLLGNKFIIKYLVKNIIYSIRVDRLCKNVYRLLLGLVGKTPLS